jgi:hypothetical protein
MGGEHERGTVQVFSKATGQVRVPRVAVHDVDVVEPAAHDEILQQRGEQLRVARILGGQFDWRPYALDPQRPPGLALVAKAQHAHDMAAPIERRELPGQVLNVHAGPAVDVWRVLVCQDGDSHVLGSAVANCNGGVERGPLTTGLQGILAGREMPRARVEPASAVAVYSATMTASNERWDVVGVGANSVDFVNLLPAYPQPFGAFAKMQIRERKVLCGGQTATAISTCASLGLRTKYVGVSGADENGRRIRAELATRNVDIVDLIIRDAENQFAVILVDETTGERIVLWDRDERLRLRDRGW